MYIHVYTTAEWNFIHSVSLCSQLQLYYALVTSFHSPQDIAVFYPITSSVVRKLPGVCEDIIRMRICMTAIFVRVASGSTFPAPNFQFQVTRTVS